MNGIKSVFASKTVWTAIVGLVVAVLVALGVAPEGLTSETAMAGVLGVVSLLAAIFRINATEQVTVTGNTTTSGTLS